MELTRRQFAKFAGNAAVAGMALAKFSTKAWGATAAAGDSLTEMTLAEASAKIHAGAVTSTELTKACLDRIAIYGPKLDCFITVMREKALAQAQVLDEEAKAGKFRGPLHGIPIAIKDNIDTAGTLTTAASGVFKDRVPTEDAPVVTRLVDAGAVIIGKTNLHEFAMGGGDVSYFGPARNPWNLAHNTGGSSSGSGAALAADLCFGALGTDTAGSVRMPSCYCGVTGIKPTYGLVPIRGIAPLRASLDHCGPMARHVEDLALMLNVMAGYDNLDIFSVEHPKEDYVEGMKKVSVKELRLGIPKGAFDPGPNGSAEVIAVVKTAIELLGTLTAGAAKEVDLPPTGGMMPGATGPGASLAGGTGGPVGPETLEYHEDYFKTKSDLYQPSIRKWLETIALNHPDATDYIRQEYALQLLRRTIDSHFADFDLVVMPTLKTEPPVLNDMLKRDLQNAAGVTPAGGATGGGGAGSSISSVGAYDYYGIPSLSIPCGFTQDGLPVGLMICGPHFTESKIFALAAAYEKATEWHMKKPPLTPDTPVPALITHL